MNRLEQNKITGTVGELLVQLRLFQYDVQAAPPLEDSGNDLIGVRRHTFRAIQVKTTGNPDGWWEKPNDRLYHMLALVRLHGEGVEYRFDESEIYLMSYEEVVENGLKIDNLQANHAISQEVVDRYFFQE